MRKILILTAVILTMMVGIFAAANAQSGWEWIDTGYEHIFFDMNFPDGQSEVGYIVGSTSTYNGDGIIIKTTDSGATWEQKSDNDLVGIEAVYFTDLETGYVGGWDAYFAKTTDGGDTWTEIAIDPDVWYFNDLEFWDDDNGIAVGYGGMVFVTDDAGESWTEATGVNIGVYKLDYATADVVYAVGGDEKIIKSTDGGLSWTEIYSGTFQYVFLGVNFIDENFGVVGGEDGKVMITDDGGDSWSTDLTSNFHLWRGIHVFNTDSIYVAGTPEGIYKTVDGGETWTDAYPESNYDPAFYEIIFTADNNTGYICGSQGSFLKKVGAEAAPQIGVSPEEISYPQTWVGEAVDFEVTVTNYGTALLSITDISSDDAAFYPDIASFDIAPGGEQLVMVTFEPDSEGLFGGVLTIESNDPVNPTIEVSLIGEGLMQQPIISVQEEIEFDATMVGSTSTETLTVWNIGNATLEVTEVNSSNPVFMVDSESFSVEPGDSVNVLVSFTPNEQEAFMATLEIISNDASSPTEVSMLGEGFVQQAVISVEEEVEFDTTTVGNTSTETLTVWNIGNATLEVTEVNLNNSVFMVDSESFSVEPGESVNLLVSFTPDVEGTHEAILEIISNDASSPTDVSLSGYAELETGLLESNTNVKSLIAYPNPFDNVVVIRDESATQSSQQKLRVYNLFGALIAELYPENPNSGRVQFSWDGNNLSMEQVPSGIYFGVIESANSEKSIKLIKR